eukprot:2722495-Amphidinium_carterae.1
MWSCPYRCFGCAYERCVILHEFVGETFEETLLQAMRDKDEGCLEEIQVTKQEGNQTEQRKH